MWRWRGPEAAAWARQICPLGVPQARRSPPNGRAMPRRKTLERFGSQPIPLPPSIRSFSVCAHKPRPAHATFAMALISRDIGTGADPSRKALDPDLNLAFALVIGRLSLSPSVTRVIPRPCEGFCRNAGRDGASVYLREVRDAGLPGYSASVSMWRRPPQGRGYTAFIPRSRRRGGCAACARRPGANGVQALTVALHWG